MSNIRHRISRSIAVVADQAAEANEEMRRHGITGAEYLMQGRMINGEFFPAGTFVASDRGARKAEFRRRGFFDKDGGDGDYTGK